MPKGFAYTIPAYAEWLGQQIDDAEFERVHLVLHDFGGAFGLVWASEHPERVASITLIDTGVMLGYRWHALARIWRTPVVGELFNAVRTRSGFERVINRGQLTPLPALFVDELFEESGGATAKTVLRLYRNTPPATLGSLDRAFRTLNPPTLVIWGERDVYLPVRYAHRQVETFPSAHIEVLSHCGHWPHAEDPEAVSELLTTFLQGVANHASR